MATSLLVLCQGNMNNKTYILLMAAFAALTFSSCIGKRKLAEARERLNTIKESQAGEGSRVKGVGNTQAQKLQENKIDDSISSRVNFRLQKLNLKLDSVNHKIAGYDSLMLSKKNFRKAYKKEIVPGLQLLDSFRLKNGSRLRMYKMLEEGLDVSSYTLFDLAAFFGPGKYAIPEEQKDTAEASFSPLVDSVISFSNRYKDVPQTATLVILGYADGTGFDPQSELYSTLASMLGKTEATKQELNTKLSELRAKTLIDHLRELFTKNTGKLQHSLLGVEYIPEGRGEAYPLASIKDYMEDDPRRRIVLCYWSVLPDL